MARVGEVLDHLGDLCTYAGGARSGRPCREPAVVKARIATRDHQKLDIQACKPHWQQLNLEEPDIVENWKWIYGPV